jgi:hypothetical protein
MQWLVMVMHVLEIGPVGSAVLSGLVASAMEIHPVKMNPRLVKNARIGTRRNLATTTTASMLHARIARRPAATGKAEIFNAGSITI